MGYIYLIQEREFLTQNLPIYKIGKSNQENCRRLDSYPKGSKLILCIEVDNCDLIEKELIKKLENEFTRRKDIGNEYFEGNVDEIKFHITHRINTHYLIKKKNIEEEKLKNYNFHQNLKILKEECKKLKEDFYKNGKMDITIFSNIKDTLYEGTKDLNLEIK